tara:strand:- start:221057 stop:221926 length:870 start_codon:yes stop_codon:yes gene_type:complete
LASLIVSATQLPAQDAAAVDPKAPIDPKLAIVPTEVINVIDPAKFADIPFHVDEKRSLTTKKDELFRLNRSGHLHIVGKGIGYIRTPEAYRDYHLVVEFKWGENTYGFRETRARDCGVLAHCYGGEGSYGNTYMYSIEAQMIEGGTGDILVLAGRGDERESAPTNMDAEVTQDRDGEYVFTAGAHKRSFPYASPDSDERKPRINWKDRDPDWEDVKGYRGAKEVEYPVGQWNRMDVICRDDTIKILLNGVLVNEGTNCYPTAGYIAMQTEMAECWVRKFEIHPLDSLPK